MPATLIEQPLGIEFVSTARRTRATVHIGPTCNPELARELVIGLIGLVHPHGLIDEIKTFPQYVTAIRRFTAELAERGHVGGAGRLSRARLAEYWMGAGYAREYKTRRLLAALDTELGVLAPDVRELVAGRHFNPLRRRDKRPLQPYTETEWRRLHDACRAIIKGSFAEHRAALAAAGRGRDPRAHGWSLDNLCWLLVQDGPVTWTDFRAEHGRSAAQACTTWLPAARTALFVDTNPTLAYLLLLGCVVGIVPDGLDALGIEDLDWAGDATVLLDYLKGRAGSESVTLTRRAVRLLEQWLTHSALTRARAPEPERNRLWTRYVPGRYGQVITEPVNTMQVLEWAQRDHPALAEAGIALVGDDGAPLRIDRRRIRTTFLSLRDRTSWFGSTRATVDPNHTPAVEGDHYLTASTPAQRDAIETIIENSQADLLRKAHPPVVLTTEATAELVHRFPEAVSRFGADDATLAELVTTSGRDVFVAACADQLSGLHGPKGKPCPARPWVCLLCPLALFTPRHAVNLLRLQAFFARQWQHLPAAQFMTLFGPYAQRIDDILAAFRARDPALLARAAADVGGTDNELPLLPEERTTP
ncbi:hypothetical protein IU469_30890 [Nocardia puris]|uniref:hypothetical protein n=1 Tax=Nocardia puris TaxID=208602 RepID=UPI0018958E78|nr:hypothetical protein [Nocardia puris]MBF6216358.1 hypothetical protein [Nocardia puris]MBF6370081.1 hypothetical protein [Nocardia puris]